VPSDFDGAYQLFFGHDFVLAAHAADIELIERGWLLRVVRAHREK
ncbi:hypothetical protein PSYAR_31065, partial [Pseudomonas syringae pv. aceris str. M302273]